MNQSLPLQSKLQLRLKSRLIWPALFLVSGVPAMFRFAETGAVSELLTGAGFVMFAISAFLAPLTPEWRFSARLNQDAAIGPKRFHQVVEVVSLLSIAAGFGLRMYFAYYGVS